MRFALMSGWQFFDSALRERNRAENKARSDTL
jgi:hypothetical protein